MAQRRAGKTFAVKKSFNVFRWSAPLPIDKA